MKYMILTWLLLTTACGDQESPKEESKISVVHEYSENVAPKPLGRNVGSDELAKAVGRDCRDASESEFKGSTSDQDFYALKCRNADFLVSVKLDGSTNVLDCDFSERMGTPCWKPW